MPGEMRQQDERKVASVAILDDFKLRVREGSNMLASPAGDA